MLDLDIAYALIYPQKINYIPVDDEYYETVCCAESMVVFDDGPEADME